MTSVPDQRRFIDALLRNDIASFTSRVFRELHPGRSFEPNWHHDAIAYLLDVTAITGENQRLIINVPPRSLKSVMISIALPAFVLGRNPDRKIIVVSYNSELAADFGRKTRQVMQSEWYQALFPSTRIVGRGAETAFYTTLGGGRISTSVEGTLTGRGGDLIIIDDPQKASDAGSEARRDSLYNWATETLFTRLDDKRTGSIILVQQRLHERDMTGQLLAAKGWMHLSLPAIATEDVRICLGRSPPRFYQRREGDLLDATREPREVLDQLRSDMGSALFQAQYQQDPVPPDGDIIKLSWFKRFETLPPYDRIVMSIDTASKPGLRNDYSVICFWHVYGDRYYLSYVWRRKVEYPELRRIVLGLADERRPDTILVEDKGAGIGLIQDLRDERTYYPVKASDPGSVDKETRMRVQSAKIEQGRVWLPLEANWLADFENEMRSFPGGAHDDQVDAVSQFLAHMSERRGDLIVIR